MKVAIMVAGMVIMIGIFEITAHIIIMAIITLGQDITPIIGDIGVLKIFIIKTGGNKIIIGLMLITVVMVGKEGEDILGVVGKI